MEAVRLSVLKENTYIPPQVSKKNPIIPSFHPCLIIQDKQTDNKIKPCGCPDEHCIMNASKWIPKPR